MLNLVHVLVLVRCACQYAVLVLLFVRVLVIVLVIVLLIYACAVCVGVFGTRFLFLWSVFRSLVGVHFGGPPELFLGFRVLLANI